jgi:hypothetical protein
MLAFRSDGTTGDNFAGPGSLYVDITNAGALYIQTRLHYDSPSWRLVTRDPVLMLTHKDPEVQAMLGLLENQRDYLMGLVAAQAKQLAELNAKLEAAMKEPENQDGKSTV